jgi:hypothetical protein
MLTTIFTAALLGGEVPLDAAEQKRVKAAVMPTETDEKWLKIDWRANLWDARKEAAEQGKPILLWEMDGHPLGCT